MTDAERIKNFTDQVRWMSEVDYGDFKRRVGLYLNRLMREVQPTDPGVRAKFQELKTSLLFQNNGNIEESRRRSIKIAEELLASLEKH